MALPEQIKAVGERVDGLRASELGEEATKTSLTMPLLHALGYDVFNPNEVLPEFTADVGIKKGEKVDYAILRDGKPIILIECKPLGAPLDNYSTQLYRYFNTTDARIAILTDGARLRFFSDLRERNRMDPDPFLEVDLELLDDNALAELSRVSKHAFDLDEVLEAAGHMKMVTDVGARIREEFQSPSDRFVRVIAQPIHEGNMTQSVVERYREVIRASINVHVRKLVDARLTAALSRPEQEEEADAASVSDETDPDGDERGIETTVEELEGYYAVKAIVRDLVDVERVAHRDTKSYFSVLLDDNNRKPICRLWFNGRKKHVGVFDALKQETKLEVSGPDELFRHADRIRDSLNHRLAE